MKKMKFFAGYFLLCAMAFSMLYPFFAMLNLSFADNADFFSNPGSFIHLDLTLENYKRLFADIPIFQYFLNTRIICIQQLIFKKQMSIMKKRLKSILMIPMHSVSLL